MLFDVIILPCSYLRRSFNIKIRKSGRNIDVGCIREDSFKNTRNQKNTHDIEKLAELNKLIKVFNDISSRSGLEKQYPEALVKEAEQVILRAKQQKSRKFVVMTKLHGLLIVFTANNAILLSCQHSKLQRPRSFLNRASILAHSALQEPEFVKTVVSHTAHKKL